MAQFHESLLERGFHIRMKQVDVSWLFLILSRSNKGFGGNKVEKEAQPKEPEAVGVTEEDKKWRLEAYDPAEWQVCVAL
jgi:hypothetical protein